MAQSEGHDFPGLLDKPVPGIAAVVEDVVVGCEDPVAEPVVAQVLPDILDRVEFRGSWRQREQGDVVGHDDVMGDVPSGSVEHQDGMGAGIDGEADLFEVCRHRRGVAARQDEGGALALLGADRLEDVGVFGALILGGRRPCPAARPAARQGVLLADPGLVLPPEFDRRSRREPRLDRAQFGGQVFLKAASVAGS